MITPDFIELSNSLQGDVNTDVIHRTIYATDASVYKEMPLAVVFPKNAADIQTLISFARKTKLSLIPRAAGTSLAGQVVGNGIIVDVGRYMNSIIEINEKERFAWVEPGVVLEELNQTLKKHGLFFGPETSTANRCMVGGMLGNNACGLHSLVYGSTRDHTLAVEGILSDGSPCLFEELSPVEFSKKKELNTLEGDIYKTLDRILAMPENQKEIRDNYPDPRVPRRNTGYALDLLLNMQPFTPEGEAFNVSKLLGGSEGTLVFSTRIKLNLVPLPPPHNALVCAHFSEIQETLQANLVVLKNKPTAVELMDNHVLSCTKSNKEQEANRYFVEGEPKTILIIEFAEESAEELNKKVSKTISDLKEAGLGYAYPVIEKHNISKVWNLRKAGLGLLSNVPGDKKSVTVIEDTAVLVDLLPAYIGEIEELFERNNMTCVYHAHIGTGELHLRPVLNLKSSEDLKQFRMIAEETVLLVKKYRGSFSGEHGDGRLRGTFIKDLYGENLYELLKVLKLAFDPDSIFNPGKIIDSPPMDEFLRYEPDQITPEFETYFDFSDSQGYLRAIEKCNGSGDCRKSHHIGGAMCPSFQATRDEKNTTRARANMLREYLTNPPKSSDPFDQPEVIEILDLCLSCKACKSECPSSVDMAKLKAEYLSHWYQKHRIPLRTRIIANISSLNSLAALWPGLSNLFLKNKLFSQSFNRLIGFAPQRSLPPLSGKPLNRKAPKLLLKIKPSTEQSKGKVCLYIDEFTDYNDGHIGEKAIEILSRLGYEVVILPKMLSARTYLSKGLLKTAKKIINQNLVALQEVLKEEIPIIGIEPSALLGFRDEYPDLAAPKNRRLAELLTAKAKLFDEFLVDEHKNGQINQNLFTDAQLDILVHGHCQQKAMASTTSTLDALAIPSNYSAEEIPSGCCGMAGSFGYEKEHYELSMQVGELVLFPAVRNKKPESLICAAGTSCRHQIKDGTGTKAYHPIEILHSALI